MNIQFNKIIIDSFMSVDHVELDLKDLGVVLVKGCNESEPKSISNGSGKSAITSESILWCLTGSTNKEAKTINNLYKPNSVATVKLEMTIDNDNYVIERINTGTKELHIYKNNVDISGNTYTKTKEILEKELGFVNKDILTSIIILGQGLKGRFSDLKASERKTRLEYLVGIDTLLEKISNSLDNADQVITKNTNEINLKLAEQNTIISSSNEIIKKYSVDAPIDETEYNNKKEEYNNLVDQYDTMRKDVLLLKEESQKYLTEKDTHNTDLVVITKQLSDVKTEINNIQHKKQILENNKNSLLEQKSYADKAECPTCHQHLANKDVEEHIKEELNKIEQEISNLAPIEPLNKQMSELVVKSEEKTNKISDLQLKINEYTLNITNKTTEATTIYNKIQELDNYLKQYETYKKEVQQRQQIIKDSQDKIVIANKNKEELDKQTAKLNNDKNINKYFKNAVSRKFRNFLLEGVFSYINHKLESYSKALFTNQIIKLESNGNNIDIRLGDKYIEDCSGGECRKIDIAIQFALRDLAKNQRGLNINLICLDEVLDYLDTMALEEVIKFIEHETVDVNTMFITSHKNDITINYDNIMEVYKGSDNLTKIRDFQTIKS